MGYRVGNQCYESQHQATNVILSQSLPSFTPDGIIRPEPRGKEWYLNNQQVVLSFPECSPVEDFQDGFTLSMSVYLLFVFAFGIRVIIHLIREAYSGE